MAEVRELYKPLRTEEIDALLRWAHEHSSSPFLRRSEKGLIRLLFAGRTSGKSSPDKGLLAERLAEVRLEKRLAEME